MISALTSYIWGDDETTESAETNPEESSVVTEGNPEETISPEDVVTIADVSNEDVDNEWIFIRPNKQGKYIDCLKSEYLSLISIFLTKTCPVQI